MKNNLINQLGFLLLMVLLINCKAITNQDEPNCTKFINKKIYHILENDFKLTKQEIYNTNRLIFNVYLDNKGRIDSLNFIKYKPIGREISETKIKEKIKKISFKCIYKNYYFETIKPTHYTFIFNPKMVKE